LVLVLVSVTMVTGHKVDFSVKVNP